MYMKTELKIILKILPCEKNFFSFNNYNCILTFFRSYYRGIMILLNGVKKIIIFFNLVLLEPCKNNFWIYKAKKNFNECTFFYKCSSLSTLLFRIQIINISLKNIAKFALIYTLAPDDLYSGH